MTRIDEADPDEWETDHNARSRGRGDVLLEEASQ